MNTRKSKFLLTTAVLLAGVSLASAQGMREGGSGGMSAGGEAGGGAAEHGRSGGGMSLGAGGAHSEGMTQDHARGRGGGPSAAHDSDRAAGKGEQTVGQDRGERDKARQSQSGYEKYSKDQSVGHSQSDRDQARQSKSESEKSGGRKDLDQTIGQGRSDHDNARQFRSESEKSRQKNQTVGQGRSNRDNARQSKSDSDESGHNDRTAGQSRSDRTRQSQDVEQNKSATTGANAKDNAQGKNAQGQATTTTGANTKSNAQGQAQGSSVQQDEGTTSGANTQEQANTQAQARGGAIQSMSGRVQVNAQQQTRLQQSVLNSPNVERVRINDNAINFRIDTGVVVPRNVSVVSVSAYPALIDIYPDYRDDSFFVVDDEIVVTDQSRRIVDVIPAGPRMHYAHRGNSRRTGGSVAALDLSPDEIRVVQRVLIERGLLSGEADGVLGPDTRAALISFQRQEGFQATGSIDTRTVAALGVSNQISATQGQSMTVGQGRNGESTQQNTTGQSTAQTNAPVQNQTTGRAGQNQPSTSGQVQQTQPKTSGQAGTNEPSGQTTGQAPAQNNNLSTKHPGTNQNTRPGQTNQNNVPPPSTSGQPAEKQPSR